MRADFQPHIHAEIRERTHRRGKLHRLAHTASPMLGAAGFARAAFAGDGAEKWDCVRLWFEVGNRDFEILGRGPHERVVERMIHAHEAREDALRLEFGEHRFERNLGAGQG